MWIVWMKEGGKKQVETRCASQIGPQSLKAEMMAIETLKMST